MEDLQPFRIAVPDAAIDDLKRRLASTRWPDRETVDDWSQGVPRDKLRALVEHWRDRHDWRAIEARLNGFPQFRTTIDGLGIHFLHVRSEHEGALPLLLTHGWPGSVVEFLAAIPLLTNPTAHGGTADEAFHLVIPSLPGFGWSDKPTAPGWNVPRIARAWAGLMARLGYSRWVAQGGDWGGHITAELGRQEPAGLAAIHVNYPRVLPEPLPVAGSTYEEQRALDGKRSYNEHSSGYNKQQATRPQTLGYGLADSPARAGGLDLREVLGVDRQYRRA